MRTCKVNARLMRWILAIQNYHIQVEHCPGKKNIVADTLSRQHPTKAWEKEKNETEIIINELKYECGTIQNKGRNFISENKRNNENLCAKKDNGHLNMGMPPLLWTYRGG